MTKQELLSKLRTLLKNRQYRIRSHVVRHMIEEGFDEEDILESLLGRCRILENYPSETRCLLAGYFRLSQKVHCPLHAVCDYSKDEVVDIVTAYIPQKPWWNTPTKRG